MIQEEAARSGGWAGCGKAMAGMRKPKFLVAVVGGKRVREKSVWGLVDRLAGVLL
jgi:hypothetical protein